MYSMPETEEEKYKEVKAVIERVNEEMDMLLDFLLKYYPDDFGVGESVIEIAIRLLKKNKEEKK